MAAAAEPAPELAAGQAVGAAPAEGDGVDGGSSSSGSDDEYRAAFDDGQPPPPADQGTEGAEPAAGTGAPGTAPTSASPVGRAVSLRWLADFVARRRRPHP